MNQHHQDNDHQDKHHNQAGGGSSGSDGSGGRGLGDLFGAEVIDFYSRASAIADGILVDVTETPERRGSPCPWR
jgi:hypothetical protein